MRADYGRRTFLVHLSMVATLALATTSPVAAQHPNHPLGFDPTRTYQDMSQVDVIDVFSGTLGLEIPVGPFALTYNSNVWRYEIRDEANGDFIYAFPDRERTAGIGWHLGLGEVYHATHNYNSSGRWLYVDDMGGHHVFYRTLHKDENDGDETVYYTRDGSYLRLKDQTTAPPQNCHWTVDIHFPDGSIRRFNSGNCGWQSTYRLAKAWGPVADEDDPEASTPELTVTYDVDPADPDQNPDTLRTITDRFGRVHRIHLSADFPFINRVVTEVDVEGFGGDRYLYQFSYDTTLVNRSCKDDWADSPLRLPLPHLIRVDLPDGTAYSMKEPGERLYYNLCINHLGESIDDVPGVLYGIDLPTGGKIRWEFQENEYPPGEGASVFATTAGVGSRTLLEPDGSELGGAATWSYKVTRVNPGGGADPEVHADVVYPTGDCSRHFFDARTSVNTAQWLGWEYGLPFVYSDERDGRYLSSQIWTSNSGNGSCSGTLLRSTYLQFRHDVPPASNCADPDSDFCYPLDWYNLNRQVKAARTVFHDDGDVWADADHWEFDGIGHFRREILTGNFWSGSANNERRETFVNFNRASGVYFDPDYVPPGPDDPWVLGIHDFAEVTETDAVGESTRRLELGFESDTGFLWCSRILASGTSRSPQDVVTFRTRNDRNQVIDSMLYGGDLQPLSVTGADCGDLPAQPAYWERNAYAQGARISTRPLTPAGTPGPFLSYDVDVDPSTGWTSAQRDPAGHEVTFDYDDAGRLDTVQPADGAQVRLTYDNATGGPDPQSSSLVVAQWSADGTTRLSERETVFDAFGRSRLERRLLPGGVWAEQETVRNARGWIVSESEWGDLSKVTQRLEFDPFGRPGRIRPPSTSAHDVKLTHWGDRKTKREVRVRYWDPATQQTGLAYVPHIEVYDRYGRLRKVQERSGPAGELVDSSYSYDVAGRLTAIASGNGAGGPVQARAFAYDNRGFPLAETHPEKGPAGNGTVSYQDFDAAGLPHRKIDGPHDLELVYDFMGRVTEIRDNNQNDRTVSRFEYDLAPGRGLGKPWRIDRVNWVELPWDPGSEVGVEVRQSYRYEGRAGAVSHKETRFTGWDLGTVKFVQDYTYDELGNLESLRYPRCQFAGCTGTAAAEREVDFSYENGQLTAVPGWVDAITYLDSGRWSQIQHANGVVDVLTPDPDFTRRIRRLRATGVLPPGSPGFDTGVLRYDGASNLEQMGPADFAYDKAQRLVRADYGGGLLREYGYDKFGNLTLVRDGSQTVNFGVDAATNRLTGAGYDGAGNLVSWVGAAFAYDTDNRLVSQTDEVYLYDALGERAATLHPPHVFGEVEPRAVFHLRDPADRVLSRIAFFPALAGLQPAGWARDRDYIYGAGRLLGLQSFEPAGPEIRHYHLDHLGSPRLITRADRTVYASHTFMPYGEDVAQGGDDDPTLFAGYERDRNAGTDYLHARHYSPGLCRFLSTDPELGDVAAPQRLNRYSYVMGNPLSFIDPSGMDPEDGLNVDNSSTGDDALDIGFAESITIVASYYQTGNQPLTGNPPNYYTFTFYPGRYGSSSGGTDPTPVTREEPRTNPPPRDGEGGLDCSGQTYSILCELHNKDNKASSDLDCGLLAFGGVSVVAGVTAAWGLAYGGLEGMAYGANTPATGAQVLVGDSAGAMAYLPNYTFGGTQAGFFGSIFARGAVGGSAVTMLAGGPIAFAENMFYGAGLSGGAMAVGLAGDAVDRGVGALWRWTGCGK